MPIAAKVHKAANGKWWYAPLTLISYWFCGILCLWATGAIIVDGQFDYLWRSTRILAGGDRIIEFQDNPVGFVIVTLLFAVSGLMLFLMGWAKFLRRRQSYLASAKCF